MSLEMLKSLKKCNKRYTFVYLYAKHQKYTDSGKSAKKEMPVHSPARKSVPYLLAFWGQIQHPIHGHATLGGQDHSVVALTLSKQQCPNSVIHTDIQIFLWE